MKKKAILALFLTAAIAFCGLLACSAVVSVEFNTGEGSLVKRQLLSNGSFAARPQSPVRTGYDFENWYEDKEYTKLFDFENTKISQDTVIYAKWTRGKFTISFSTLGHEVSDLTMEYGAALEPFDESFRTGYRFTGWYTDSACTKIFQGATMPAENITLYAGWQSDSGYSAFTFLKNETGYTLASVSDIKLSVLSVPETYNNLPVNRVGKAAFENAKRISEVVLHDGINTVEEAAFEGCAALRRVVLPPLDSFSPRLFYGCSLLESVLFTCEQDEYKLTFVGAAAFYGCTALSGVYLPDGLTSIGDRAFTGCVSLTEIDLPDSVAVIGDRAFSGCQFGFVKIPSALLDINPDVFYNCSRLETVDFGSKIQSIGYGAFENCASLSAVNLPQSVAYIGDRAFAGTGITELDLSFEISEIGAFAFLDCSRLAVAKIPYVTSISDYMFFNCVELGQVQLSESLLSIGVSAFEGCVALQSVNLPEALESIGVSAFKGSALSEVSLPARITEIPAAAFEGCRFLTRVTLPQNLLEIGDYAFSGCAKLRRIFIPDTATTIGYCAFWNCHLLVEFNFGFSLRDVGGYAFEGTGWLNLQPAGDVYVGKVFYLFRGGSYVEFRQDTVAIAGYAFFGNKSIISVDIPKSVEVIGDSAFRDCTHLTEASLFAYSAGTRAFANCTSLFSAELNANLTAVSDDMFNNCTSLESICIPASVGEIGFRAFYGCGKLKSVSFETPQDAEGEACLKIIKTSAFEWCRSLEEIELPDSVAEIMNFAFKETALRRLVIGAGIKIIREQAVISTRFVESATDGEPGSDPKGAEEQRGLTVYIKGFPTVRLNSFLTGAWLKIILPDQLYSEVKSGVFSQFSGYDNWSFYSEYIYKNSFVRDGFVIEKGRLVAYLGKETDIEIPDDVEVIAPYTFSGMDFITSVRLDFALKVIGERAFYATGITRLDIHDGLTDIGAKAFWVKSYLYRININIPVHLPYHSAVRIGAKAFKTAGCYVIKIDGENFYRFGGDSRIYDAFGKIAVFSDGQESAALAAFDKLTPADFNKKIIFLNRLTFWPQYQVVWAEYVDFFALS